MGLRRCGNLERFKTIVEDKKVFLTVSTKSGNVNLHNNYNNISKKDEFSHHDRCI